MFDWLREFFTSEDAAVLGGGLGAIVGGFYISYQAIRKGKPTSPALAQVIAGANCRIPDLAPQIGKIVERLTSLETSQREQDEAAAERDDEAREREERAEGQRENISRSVTEILKLVIRLDERTQGRRG